MVRGVFVAGGVTIGVTTVGVLEGGIVAKTRSVGRDSAIDVADKVGAIVAEISIGLLLHAPIDMTDRRMIANVFLRNSQTLLGNSAWLEQVDGYEHQDCLHQASSDSNLSMLHTASSLLSVRQDGGAGEYQCNRQKQ